MPMELSNDKLSNARRNKMIFSIHSENIELKLLWHEIFFHYIYVRKNVLFSWYMQQYKLFTIKML